MDRNALASLVHNLPFTGPHDRTKLVELGRVWIVTGFQKLVPSLAEGDKLRQSSQRLGPICRQARQEGAKPSPLVLERLRNLADEERIEVESRLGFA